MTRRAGLALGMLGMLGVLAACDAPSASDDDVRLAPADAIGVVAPTAPAAVGELALTQGDADDLFPALHGDDLVWVRIDVDASVLGPDDEPPDCMVCTWCAGCRWRVMHRRLSAPDEHTLWTGRHVSSAPTVHEGLTSFVDGDGILRLVGLAQRVTESIPHTGHLGRAPRVHEGIVWWLGWRDGGMNILAWDVTVPGFVTQLRADVTERWWVAGGLGGIGRPQPFVLDGERVVWTAATTEGRVESARLADGERTTLVVDPARIHLAPLVLGDTIVTLSYDVTRGCSESSCELALSHIDPGADAVSGVITPLAEGAAPSQYVSPVGDGRRVVWVDKRAGAYMLVGIDLADGGEPVERRLSSEDARVGATSPPAIDDGRVVWSDRRSGRWQLIMRRW